MTTNPLQHRIQGQAFNIVYGQLVGVFIIAAIGLAVGGIKCSYSLLAGSFANVLPNILLVWRVFKYVRPSQISQFISAFFIFEMIKLILSGILFLLVVKHLPVSLLSVLIGFIGAIVSFWISSSVTLQSNIVAGNTP